MAVMIASGSYLPRCLTFGPTNGLEDFQEVVFIAFSRWLYKRWFLFLDDLTVLLAVQRQVVQAIVMQKML